MLDGETAGQKGQKNSLAAELGLQEKRGVSFQRNPASQMSEAFAAAT